MADLNDSMEQQIQWIDRFRHQEGDRLGRDHIWSNINAMWKEVNIARRTKLDEGLEEA